MYDVKPESGGTVLYDVLLDAHTICLQASSLSLCV